MHALACIRTVCRCFAVAGIGAVPTHPSHVSTLLMNKRFPQINNDLLIYEQHSQVVDAVVCDPPYGVRAGGRKSQSIPDRRIKDRTTHISATAPYFLGVRRPWRDVATLLSWPLLLLLCTMLSDVAWWEVAWRFFGTHGLNVLPLSCIGRWSCTSLGVSFLQTS